MATTMTTYPLTPKTNAQLIPGQFWSIPLSDGRFGCGRVLRVERDKAIGGRTRFIGAILDWVGDEPPSYEAIAGRPVLAVGNAHVRLISFGGGVVMGERPLDADGIEPPARVDTYWGDGFSVMRAERRFIAGDPPPTSDFREVSSPLTGEMLRPSLTGRGIVHAVNDVSFDVQRVLSHADVVSMTAFTQLSTCNNPATACSLDFDLAGSTPGHRSGTACPTAALRMGR